VVIASCVTKPTFVNCVVLLLAWMWGWPGFRQEGAITLWKMLVPTLSVTFQSASYVGDVLEPAMK